jgi:hypothetical protein
MPRYFFHLEDGERSGELLAGSREWLRVNRMIRFVHNPLDRWGATPTLSSAAEIAEEPAYRAQRVAVS